MKELARRNYDFCIETIGLVRVIEENFLEVGARLSKIYKEELYKPGWDTWQDYLEDMRMSESKASRLSNIHARLEGEFEIPKTKLLAVGSWSDLSEVLPIAKDKKEALQIIEKITPLDREGRRQFLRKKKTGIDPDNHEHDYYILKICKTGGERIRIYDDEN